MKMPKFQPSSLDQRVERALAAKKRTHFSQADWDFQNVNWTLDGAIYHTAAPSIHGTALCAALVKDATTGALSDGRLVFWVRAGGAYLTRGTYFRNQHADGGADYQNTYWISPDANSVRFYVYLAGTPTLIDDKAMTWEWSVDTWYKIRFTWWTSVDRLYVRVERWTGTEWTTLGGDADTDFEDVNDRWKDETVNRCGTMLWADLWFDDLEVWG